jgi:pilus assembly protein Flp/PilA
MLIQRKSILVAWPARRNLDPSRAVPARAGWRSAYLRGLASSQTSATAMPIATASPMKKINCSLIRIFTRRSTDRLLPLVECAGRQTVPDAAGRRDPPHLQSAANHSIRQARRAAPRHLTRQIRIKFSANWVQNPICTIHLNFSSPPLTGAAPGYGNPWRKRNMSKIQRFVRDESGATAIEYGLIAAGIAVAIITVVGGLGGKLNTTFTSVSDALK